MASSALPRSCCWISLRSLSAIEEPARAAVLRSLWLSSGGWLCGSGGLLKGATWSKFAVMHAGSTRTETKIVGETCSELSCSRL